MFHEYPYNNVNDLNLDYLLKNMKTLAKEFEDFASTNGLKAADPIIWEVTRSYAPNTIVVTNSGNAYISRKPVPAGVIIENDEYWTKAFDFSIATYKIDNEELIVAGVVSESRTYGDTHRYEPDAQSIIIEEGGI